ncbi:MAG TPA: cytochrome c1, partial [Hyphomicrobiales bacterium]|nr:cytochrome c1 [Hyphomicrobiales bacterium]
MTHSLAGALRPLFLASLIGAVGGLLPNATPVAAAEAEGPALPEVEWSFAGPFGTFDRGQLQRGYKVYREVCSACH